MSDFMLSSLFCAHNNIAVLEKNKNNFIVGMVNYADENLKQLLKKRFLECCPTATISFKKINYETCAYNLSDMISPTIANVEHQNPAISDENEQSLEIIAQKAPVINFLNALILDCIQKNGSDIHFQPTEKGLIILFRIDGDLVFVKEIEKELGMAILFRILFLAQLDCTELRRFQDGGFHFSYSKKNCDIRVSMIPSFFGLSCVLRILNRNENNLNLDTLGFSQMATKKLKEVCFLKNTLILVCGPTGCGKTTTIAAILKNIIKNPVKVITIEDPVEYPLCGAVQIPVNMTTSMDYSHVLKGVLRHDPDVLMIGEIRDTLTAKAAIRAALTGHLVFATIHTKDAPSAIIRLLDLGVESYLLASVFGLAISQRLVRSKKILVASEILENSYELSSLIRSKASLFDFRLFMKKNGILAIEDDMRKMLFSTGEE